MFINTVGVVFTLCVNVCCVCSVYVIKYRSDDAVVYSGTHYLVNYKTPDFTPMSFIAGGGPFVTMWWVPVL